jgi:NADPH:quinone reductase-like Zn-dependent oxidoreductase
MRAVVQSRYGGPEALALREIDPPAIADDELLVRVHAASLHPDVWHVLRGQPYVMRVLAPRRPRRPVPGIDLAGVVEAVGAEVTRFEPGDAVFGETVRGFQWTNGGAFAELAAAPEEALARKPERLSFVEAASVPTSGLIALQSVRDQGHVRAGQQVLVNGAGGGVGTFAVQLAKAFGAHVTAVDVAAKLDMLRDLADRVIDPAEEDFTQGRYDLIVDIPGNRPYREIRRALTPEGIYVIVAHDAYGADGRRWFGSLPSVLPLVARSLFDRRLPKPDFAAPRKRAAMETLADFAEAGRLTPVIDRTFPLEEVADAIRYLESGAVQGKVVIALT